MGVEEEAFHGDKVRGLNFVVRIISHSVFIGSGKALPNSVLLHPFTVSAETPQSVSIVLECRKCSLIAYSDSSLHLDLLGIVLVLIAVSMTVFFPGVPFPSSHSL
jgi:hypothetical protein